MTQQQIRDNAPEGANKYMITKQGIQYFQRECMNMWYLWEDKQWKIMDSTLIYIVKNKVNPSKGFTIQSIGGKNEQRRS